MAPKKEISKVDFSRLKMAVSQWYDSRYPSCSMFKVLFRDKIDNNKLSNITGTLELLNELCDSDYLSTTNLTILYNTIKITKHFGLIKQISKYIKSLPDIKEMPITEFSEHRQKLIKFGNVLTNGGVKHIDGLYNTPLKNYKDSWSMITHLEEKKKISEGDALKKFVVSLKELNHPLAVNALTEEIIQLPRPNKPQSQDIIDKTKSKSFKRTRKVKRKIETSYATTSQSSSTRPNTTEYQDEPKQKSRRVKSEPIPTYEIRDTPSATDMPDTSSDTPHTENPYWMKKISAEKLRQLLDDVSEWWEQFGSINMLKVILNDFENITVAQIEQQIEANPLFQLLLANGYINPTDVDCLIEAIVLGGQSGVEPKIKETIPTFPGFSKVVINRLSKHRRNLIAFGKVLDTKNKNRIGHLYSLHVSKLTDQWCLILQLEKKLILTEDNKDEFIKKLNKNDMKAEAKALTRF